MHFVQGPMRSHLTSPCDSKSYVATSFRRHSFRSHISFPRDSKGYTAMAVVCTFHSGCRQWQGYGFVQSYYHVW